jgi:hypothetical protein
MRAIDRRAAVSLTAALYCASPVVGLDILLPCFLCLLFPTSSESHLISPSTD